MKFAKKGISLIELLISMGLSVFLLIIVTRVMLDTHIYSTRLEKKNCKVHEIYTAAHLLRMDINSAHHSIDSWIVLQSNPIWLTDNGHVQWYTKSQSLIRRTGVYLKDLQKWERYTDSLIAQDIDIFFIDPHNSNNHVEVVSYQIVTSKIDLKGFFSVKNRERVCAVK